MQAFYTKRQVCEITTLSAVTIWRKVKDGSFPPSAKLSDQKVGWPKETVDAWVNARKAEAGFAEAA